MDDAELINRFSTHTPFGDQAQRYDLVRAACLHLARQICTLCPDSREQALALTHLDQVMFSANAAIARREVPPPDKLPPPT